jgi:sigma-B regulation protein RsbU (phosphoserine phosphatase)
MNSSGGFSGPATSLAVLIFALTLAAYILYRRYLSRRLLMQQVAELEALSAAGRAIVAAQLDVRALCALIASEAGKVLDNETFQVGLFNGDFYEILFWRIRGIIQPTPAIFDLSEEGGIISWVRRTHYPLLVKDFQKDRAALPAKPRYISDNPPLSAIFIPLVSGDQCIGILAAQHQQANRFSEEDLRRLTILANQAAAAIAHAQLFAQERKRAAQLELVGQIGRKINSIQNQDEIFSQVVSLTQETFGFHFVSIFTLDPESGTAVLKASSAPEAVTNGIDLQPVAGLVGMAISRQETIISNNTDEDERFVIRYLGLESATGSEMAIPLIVDGAITGVLDLQSPEKEVFTETEKTTLEALAAEIALAIGKVRQLERQREDAWFSTAQLQVAEAISRAADMNELVASVSRLTPLLSGVNHCAILRWDEEHGRYHGTQLFSRHTGSHPLVHLHIGIGSWSPLDAVHVGQQPLATQKIPIWYRPFAAELPDTPTLQLYPLNSLATNSGVMIVNRPTRDESKWGKQDELLQNISLQVAQALENAALRLAQQEEAWVNAALFQVAAAVNNLMDLNEILTTITRLVSMLIGVETCLILVWNEETETFQPGASYGVSEMGRGLLQTLEIDQEEFRTFTPQVIHSDWELGSIYIISPPPWLKKVIGTANTYAFPLYARGRLEGAMLIGSNGGTPQSSSSPTEHRLTNRHLNILSGIAHTAATAVINHQLYQQAAEQKRLEQELDVARDIQASLIPAGNPNIPGCTVDSYWHAARQVSGDFYDFMPLANNSWGIVVADVADKGIPAALFMALSRTILRTVAFSRDDPAQTLIRVNQILNNDAQTDHFVTAFYAIWNPNTHRLTYANGGHNPPLLIRESGKVKLLTGQGIALGVLPNAHIEKNSLTFRRGDVLLLYTDGVTEAINEDYDEFGLERLKMTVENVKQRSAAAIRAAITEALINHAGDTAQFDDITLVVLKRDD